MRPNHPSAGSTRKQRRGNNGPRSAQPADEARRSPTAAVRCRAAFPTVTQPGPAPTGLRIPDLNIDNGPIKPVGVEPNGDFEVPIASEIGWYRFGSRPGQDGSNVLAAHIAYDGQDGVFRYLSTLEPGSIVEVVLEDGSVVSYETTERTTYEKVALPFDELFDKSGPDRLVLVTCGGNFDASAGSYDSNIVVFAKRVD